MAERKDFASVTPELYDELTHQADMLLGKSTRLTPERYSASDQLGRHVAFISFQEYKDRLQETEDIVLAYDIEDPAQQDALRAVEDTIDLKAIIDNSGLSGRDLQFLVLRFPSDDVKGMTFEMIGQQFGIDRSTAALIEKRVLSRLRRSARELGLYNLPIV